MHRCPYKAVLTQLAEVLCETLTKRLIRRCQAQGRGVGSDELQNLWEEICVGVRSDHPLVDAYCRHLEQHLMPLVCALPVLEQQLLWAHMHDDVDDPTVYPSSLPEDWPLDLPGITRYILNEHVMYQCWNYENARIRAAEGR
jgi:hypothetical protein